MNENKKDFDFEFSDGEEITEETLGELSNGKGEE